MPYTQTTFAQAQSMLLSRLSDSSGSFWSSTPNGAGYNEIGGYIQEALRTWGAFTHYWRDRGSLQFIRFSPPFLDITNIKNASGVAIRSYNVTDAQLLAMMEFHLLEPATPAAYSGSSMFAQSDFTQALQNRLNQFIFETGCTLTHSQQGVAGNQSRVVLPPTTAFVQRTGWISADSLSAAPLWRGDEMEMMAFMGTSWNTTSDQPQIFSVIASSPLSLQLAPIPNANFILDLLTLSNGPALNPASGVLLKIPDESAWAIKWGAMADLLAKDGPAFDIQRAAYCEGRYREGVLAANSLPVVLQAQFQGIIAPIVSVLDLDQSYPGWQGIKQSGSPFILAPAGANLAAVYPIPDNTYDLVLDVVANPVVPALGTDAIQLGQEELDAVLDYAQHLASFKLGGDEFQATQPLYNNFMKLALNYNQTLRASSKFLDIMWGASQRENAMRPRKSVEAIQ
ncbi:MAG: hypothetical protein KGL39_37270 [Patescibacteria group bacterium]|nr:hypothetical protein [Patescibacteria group bacterium]